MLTRRTVRTADLVELLLDTSRTPARRGVAAAAAVIVTRGRNHTGTFSGSDEERRAVLAEPSRWRQYVDLEWQWSWGGPVNAP